MMAAGYSWTSGLFGDAKIAEQFSDAAMFASFARIEQALITGLAKARLIETADAEGLVDQIGSFEPDPAAIAAASVHDGVPAPEYVRQLRAHVSGPGSAMVHHGATSQDLVDTATVSALCKTTEILAARLDMLRALIGNRAVRDGDNVLQAITRMQPALRFQASERFATWQRPLDALRIRLDELGESTRVLQLGGAVGDLQQLGVHARVVAETVADELDLTWPGHSWHTARAPFIAYAGWLSELTGALGKMGQDIALMALRGESDIKLSGGGTSSAMPHKQNPVTAEVLVTLARYNATLVAGMHQAQIHEMERSGAAWMLEWMILPQMCEAAGAGLIGACSLIKSIDRIGVPT